MNSYHNTTLQAKIDKDMNSCHTAILQTNRCHMNSCNNTMVQAKALLDFQRTPSSSVRITMRITIRITIKTCMFITTFRACEGLLSNSIVCLNLCIECTQITDKKLQWSLFFLIIHNSPCFFFGIRIDVVNLNWNISNMIC